MDGAESSIGEIVREAERDYTKGTTHISKYVDISMWEIIQRVSAYLNSKFLSGDKDTLGRDKAFANIVIAAANIWQRATDIDRSNIKIRATKSKDDIGSFLATVHLRNWMRLAKFGMFLNDWGRTLARYGSALVKFVEQEGELVAVVVPWNKLIVDAVDLESNPIIEVLELTEAQLRKNENYDQEIVDNLIKAREARETLDKKKKDTKSHYYKLYEIHGEMSLETYELAKNRQPKEGDDKIYLQQMHVVSFVGGQKKKGEWEDFILYSGKEDNPYLLTHLIPEEDRSLAIGAVEHLFDSQWMVNHTMKQIKDQLDLACKLVFQTADIKFVGRNMLKSMETGDILIHEPNQPLTQVDNDSHDTSSLRDYAEQWRRQGREIVGVSEAMLGAAPKSGTAWRQTEALLSESHSLFENMTENKGLYLEEMLRRFIIPHIKKKMDTSEEVSATLESHDIEKIDGRYIKNLSTREINKHIMAEMIKGNPVDPEELQAIRQDMENGIQVSLNELGGKRFFKPSEISTKTWKEQFKNLEWEVEVDITGEPKNVQEALATLGTALKVMIDPAFMQNKQAQTVVSKILELSGAISPIELMEAAQPRKVVPANTQLDISQGKEVPALTQ